MTAAPVMSITEELIAELEILADKATGGDWEYRLGLVRTQPDFDGYTPVAVAPNAPKNWRAQRDTNMQYIAAANPAVIRALLTERAELVKDRERLDWMIKEEALVVELKKAQRYHVAWPDIGENQIDCFWTPREAIDAARADNP